LIFSSNLNAILATGLRSWEYDERILAEYLIRRIHIRKTGTFYKGICKLPQASSLIWQDGQVHIREYWSIREAKPVRFQNETEYVEQFHELFSEAVRSRLCSNGKVGSHISGGLDSSSVALLANEILKTRGESLSAGYTWSPPPKNGELNGELELLDWVEHTKNIPIRYCDLTPEEAAAVYARDITRMPTNTLFSEVNILEKARKDETAVMLSGWGGDEIITFNGRGYYSSLILGFRWRQFILETHALQSPASLKLALSRLKNDLMRVWGDRRREKAYSRKTQKFFSDFVFGNLRDELQHQKFSPLLRLKPGVHQNQIQLWNNGHMACRMEDWHHQGALFGVEYRYPLLDRRIVEFALGIPEDMIFRMPWRGYLMRLYARRFFPEKKIWVNLKKEDYRQPIFQRTLRQGLDLWKTDILNKGNFSKSNIDTQNLLIYLRNTDIYACPPEDRHQLRRLLQVASLPED
jgi:asparagine synthase (glutamine-hydrolysing)